jgi:hypothetical protein
MGMLRNRRRIAAALAGLLLMTLAVWAVFGRSTSGSKGPLRFTIRLRPLAASSQGVTVHSTLTNISQQPVWVLRPMDVINRYYLDGGVDILAREYANASMAGPGSRDIVLLGAGKSLSISHFLKRSASLLTSGTHTLTGEYNTTLSSNFNPFGYPGKTFWKGKVTTAPLHPLVMLPIAYRMPIVV